MPCHVWKSTLCHLPVSFGYSLFILLDVGWFECRVFADEAGVQQDDVRAQDGFDHLQDTRVFGQAHHPQILKVNIVEAVLGVLFTWRYTKIYNIPIH